MSSKLRLARRGAKRPGYAIEPRRIVFAGEPAEDAPPQRSFVHAGRKIKQRTTKGKARIEHAFWKSRRNPDELCTVILDYPIVAATWGSLVSEILGGGANGEASVGWQVRKEHAHDAQHVSLTQFLNSHDDLCVDDEDPLTMETAARRLLATVPRGFVLLERALQSPGDPIRYGEWAGMRRFLDVTWISRELIDCDEDELGRFDSFRERRTGTEHKRTDADWWQFPYATWDENGGGAGIYGNGLCVPSYDFMLAGKQTRQDLRNVNERTGGGAVIVTLDEQSSTEYDDVADKALQMLDEGLSGNFIAALPKGMDVVARDLLAKTHTENFKTGISVEDFALQLLWVYQVASTGTDDSGAANSRARTETLTEQVGSRAGQIAGWLAPRFRALWSPLAQINFGARVVMPDLVLGAEAVARAKHELDSAVSVVGGGEPIVELEPVEIDEAKVQALAVAVAAGTLPVESARAIARAANPTLTTELTESIFGPLRDFRSATPTPAPGARGSFAEAITPGAMEVAREAVRDAATGWVRKKIERGEDVDCSRPLPLRRQFSEAYAELGISVDSATLEAEHTCRWFAERLAEAWTKAKTAGGKLRVLGQVAEELASAERLRAIKAERDS